MPYKDPETKKAYNKAYRAKNKENLNQKDKAYRAKNKEQLKQKRKEYCEENKEKVKQQRKKHYQKNRENILQEKKEYHQKNRENILQKQKKYREKNKEQLTQQKKEYCKKKRKTDSLFKFIENIRSRLRDGIKNCSGKKNNKAEELLGCSFEEGHNYITSLFKEGMSWENYGYRGWHIDHIIPVSSFDLTNPEEQKKCFHFTNLQPLWAEQNLKKGSKILNDTEYKTTTEETNKEVEYRAA